MLDIQKLAKTGQLLDNHYRLIRPLSTDGGTADVWLALDANTVNDIDELGDISQMSEEEISQIGLIVAIKIYRPQNALDIEGEQRFRDEYTIVFNCHHSNLIHPTHFSIWQETPYLVLPYCKLGSSEKAIGNMNDAEKQWKYILDVSSGLAYLHAQQPPIIHHDIKPANVLLDDNLNYSITDFGISSKRGYHDDDYLGEERSGTMAYMAPERFNTELEPMPASDIWAFGATLYEIITGSVPFGEEGGWAQVKNNAQVPEIPNIQPDIQRLIQACLDPDPEKRPTAEEIAKSAEAQQFPLKKKRMWVSMLIAAAIALVIGIVATFFLAKPEPEVIEVEIEAQTVPPDSIYPEALTMLNSPDTLIMKQGLVLMDSLSGDNYVPALYEMAFTYGWYSDSMSVARKGMLGIEVDNMLMPRREEWSTKAVALFDRILDQNDSAYADINANAAYRLACYYVMPNNIFKPNYEKGKKYLLISRDWAELTGDLGMIERIERGLASFK